MKRISKADSIRDVAEKNGFNHSNAWIKKQVLKVHNENVSVQQVASVLGRYNDRRHIIATKAHDRCKEFLKVCGDDWRLAKKILVGYGGTN
tara:strand:- start:1402 stop:1674 length:273 start_codon:yes stop_codon:yes gene_type:complete